MSRRRLKKQDADGHWRRVRMQNADGKWRYAAGTGGDPCGCSRVWRKCSDDSPIYVPLGWESSGVFRIDSGNECYTATTAIAAGCPPLTEGTRTLLTGCEVCGWVYAKCGDPTITLKLPTGRGNVVKITSGAQVNYCFSKTGTFVTDVSSPPSSIPASSCNDVICPCGFCATVSGLRLNISGVQLCEGCLPDNRFNTSFFHIGDAGGGSLDADTLFWPVSPCLDYEDCRCTLGTTGGAQEITGGPTAQKFSDADCTVPVGGIYTGQTIYTEGGLVCYKNGTRTETITGQWVARYNNLGPYLFFLGQWEDMGDLSWYAENVLDHCGYPSIVGGTFAGFIPAGTGGYATLELE